MVRMLVMRVWGSRAPRRRVWRTRYLWALRREVSGWERGKGERERVRGVVNTRAVEADSLVDVGVGVRGGDTADVRMGMGMGMSKGMRGSGYGSGS